VIQYLLDTNVCIDMIRRRADRTVARLRATEVGTVAISVFTFAELHFGVARSSDPDRNRIALAHFCAPLEISAFDGAAATAYGRLRAHLESAGTPIGPLDTLIAAQAVAMSATLVTNNRREFDRVEGLHVETWL
jgi:tRNA(fMet)-specific endonuclease VapC